MSGEKESKPGNVSFATLAETSPTAITQVDKDGNIVYANNRAEEVLGLQESEITNRTYDAPDWKITDYEGNDYPKEKLPFRLVKDSEEPVSDVRHAIEWPNGKRKHLSVNASPIFDDDGNFDGMVAVMEDITERKKVERKLKESRGRLQKAMEAGSLAWWRMELPSGDATSSDLEAEMLGYTPEEFDNSTDFTELIHPDDHDRVKEAMRAHLDGKKEKYEVEYRIRKKNGDYRWFRDVGGLTETDGEHRIVTGVVIDIDRRKEAELSLKAQRGKLEELHEAVDRFQQCETEDDLCNLAVQVTQRVLNFDLCTFYCVEGGKLVPVAATESIELDELSHHNLAEGLAGESFQKKQSILGDDLRKEERAVTDRSELKGHMSVPIGDVGVFQVASKEVGAFDQYDLELAEILAGHLHEEIKRIRLEEELRHQAIRDPLTNLYNRRYFNETLQKEVQQAERYDKPLAFLMIDVNRFKEINDSYSHRTGDKVLKEVAELLKENVRDADTVVRYGGDEFLVMMPETDGGVKNTKGRLNEELDSWNEESDLLDFPLTLAMGVSQWSPDQDRDVEEALKEADEKMYEDKRDID